MRTQVKGKLLNMTRSISKQVSESTVYYIEVKKGVAIIFVILNWRPEFDPRRGHNQDFKYDINGSYTVFTWWPG